MGAKSWRPERASMSGNFLGYWWNLNSKGLPVRGPVMA